MDIRIDVEGKDVLPLDSLTEFQGNLKELSKENYEKFKKDILNLGFISPIHIWKNGGNNFCLDGHQRIRTLRQMRDEGIKIPAIPVVYVKAKDKKEAKKKILSLTSQFGKITGEGLYEFINDAGIDFADVKNEFSFHEINFDKFESEFYDKSQEVEGQDDVPETRKTSIKNGDLYLLGNHRLLCGDATSHADVERLMNGERADLFLSDPPYGVSYTDKNEYLNSLGTGHRLTKAIENDHKSPEEMKLFWDAAFKNACESLSDKSSYYIFAPQGGDLLLLLLQAVRQAGFQLKHILVWAKNNHVLGRCDYHYKHEPIVYGWKQKGTHQFYGRGKKNTSVWDFNKPLKNDLHPTMKPIEVLEEALLNSTESSNLVLDLFLGSGSTMIACEKMGRKCYGTEIDPQYCQVIIDRWEKFTGLKATKYNRKEVVKNEIIARKGKRAARG